LTHIENLALGVDGAPQIDHPPIDLQIDFVKMPSRVRLRAALAQLRCNHRSEIIHPAAHGLVGDRDPALSQQILDVAKAEGEPEIMGWTVPAPQWKNTGRNREWCDDDYNDRT
jgi:hypothetical protein